MTAAATIADTIGDAQLALHVFIRNPSRFGGIVLRGCGPVRDEMVGFARTEIGKRGPVVKLPANADSESLLGGLDLSASLGAGKSVMRLGLLGVAEGGVLVVPMAERVASNVAAHIAIAMDSGDLAAILLDDGGESDEAPPAVLSERMAFHCDVADLRKFAGGWPLATAIELSHVTPLTDEQLRAIAATAAALGIGSVRALNFANGTARAHAALYGRKAAGDDDIAAAVRLVIAPRATQLPQTAPPPPDQPDAEHQDSESSPDIAERDIDDLDLDDIVLEAAAASIPQHILDQIDAKLQRGGKGLAGRSGQKQKSSRRGRPLGTRTGVPGNGKKLALIDSLRAAAPWQGIRRHSAQPHDKRKIHIRKSDLRVRHYEQRSESLTIFAVDASGSSALSRLAEAKGAVELMLAEAYVKRSQVALIAFRQATAEIMLPPTRSLTRARRALAALPGGGGTPLAKGLLLARQLAEAAQRGGQTPTIAILTDGKANVTMDGTANRTIATEEAHQAARTLAALGLHSIVIDISPRPRDEAAELAGALNGRYLPLPRAHNAAIVAAIENLSAP